MNDVVSPESLERYRSFLLKLAHRQLDRRLLSKVSQSDIVQRTLLRAYIKFDSFHGDSEAELRGWLASILTTQCINESKLYFATQKRRMSVERYGSIDVLPSRNPSSSAIAMNRETVASLLAGLGQLADDQREIIRLRYIEQISLEDISERLGISRHAVHRRLGSGLKKLGQLMRQDAST
ncbi:MAG: sigma-70 family RNA polymerase sigma factor [Rubripirellula sp.]